MPGSGGTSPNPVFCAMPTHPDHTSAAAGAARTSSGQDRTVRPGRAVAGDRSAPDWSGGPRRDRTTQAQVRGAGRVDSDSSHAGHHPSVVASG